MKNGKNSDDMKRLVLWAGALLTLAAFSCSRETEALVTEDLTFSAVWADGSGTRTALQENGTSIWWTAGEEINVFFGTFSSGKFTSTNGDPQELVQFRGTLDVMTGTVETPGGELAYWAVYPYDASNTFDGEGVTLSVPASQTGLEGTFEDKFFPAVAVSQNFALAFYNVCGGARFSVSQEGIQSVTFKATGGESLVGTAKVAFGEDGKPVTKSITDGSAEVTVTAPEGGFVPGKHYFAVFFPQVLSKGLSMTFRTKAGDASWSLDKPVTVNRARFGVLDEKDQDLVFGIPVPEAVDLGLSVAWASFNIGASKPEAFGDYFAWGETEPYYEAGYAQSPSPVWKAGKEAGYFWSSYRWCAGESNSLTKYCSLAEFGKNGFTDEVTVLDPADDVAALAFGEKWRMPLLSEVEELMEECTWTWTTLGGVNGYRVTGPNGNAIFLPAAGYRYLASFLGGGALGYYASASLDEERPLAAHNLTFDSSNVLDNSAMRSYGLSVRPVFGNRAVPVESVTLSPTELMMPIGPTAPLSATVLPENATNNKVSWSSSDETVATVSSTGVVTGVAAGTAIITVTTADGGKTATCAVTVVPVVIPIPEKVDLGLSVKWASFNVGARKPEDSGDYFAWGELAPYYLTPESAQSDAPEWIPGKESGYDWASYQWCDQKDYLLTKYCTNPDFGHDDFMDGKTELLPEDDIATRMLGKGWRIPTRVELDDLLEKCSWVWTTRGGVNGYVVTGANGNSIFLPAAGYRYLRNFLGGNARGYYATSSLNVDGPTYAFDLYFGANTVLRNSIPRSYGLTVRPVAD